MFFLKLVSCQNFNKINFVYLRLTSTPCKPLSGNRDAIASNSSPCFSVSSVGLPSHFDGDSANTIVGEEIYHFLKSFLQSVLSRTTCTHNQ